MAYSNNDIFRLAKLIVGGTGGTLTEVVTQVVAQIVAGAPEDFDTLQEMYQWIMEHEDSAAAMNLAIQNLKTDKLDKADLVNLTQSEYDELEAAGTLTALQYNIVEG